MTLLVADCHPRPEPQPVPRPDMALSSRGSSLFRPWAASEASETPEEPHPQTAFLPCSPKVGICAGLSRGKAHPATPPSRRSPVSATKPALPSAPSGSGPILSRLEGLVGAISNSPSNLDESSQSSCSGSSYDGSCPPSPERTPGDKGGSAANSAKTTSLSSASEDAFPASAFSATPASACDPRLMAAAPPMLSPEEVALIAAQQQAFHEEALLAMAGLLPPHAASLPGAMAPAPFYLDEYARLLQQEHKAAGLAARKQRPKKYRCPHCQVAFSNNGQLRGHVRIHTGERPFKCEEESCGKRFTRNEELTRHKRIHSGLRPFACQACGKRFGRKDHLKKHARTHDPAHRVAHLIPMLQHGMPPHPYLYGF